MLNSVMEYYSAFKRNLRLIHETNGWMSNALPKWMKPDVKDCIQYDPFFVTCMPRKKSKVRPQTSGRQGCASWLRASQGLMGLCCVLIFMLITQLCIFIKTQRSIHKRGWISLYVNCVLIFNKEENVAIAGGKNVLTKNKPD